MDSETHQGKGLVSDGALEYERYVEMFEKFYLFIPLVCDDV